MKKHRVLAIILGVCLASILLVTACTEPIPTTSPTTSPTTTPEYKFRMQLVIPSVIESMRYLKEDFPANVKTMSGGRIEIEVFEPAALVPSNELYSAVAEGVIDMCYNAPTYNRGLVGPVADFLYIPAMTLETNAQCRTLAEDLGLEDIYNEALMEHNLYHLQSACVTEPAALIFSKVPIRTLDDLKGLTIRSGGPQGDILEAAGAKILFVPTEEIYTAATTGMVDALTLAGASVNYAYGFHEVCPYLIYPGIAGAGIMEIAMNLEKWQELPDDLKLILKMALEDWAAYNDRAYAYADVNALAAMKAEGAEEVWMTDEAYAALREIAMEMVMEWIQEDPVYGEPAGQMLIDYMELLGLIE
jgi:TRAP-type mannitol/chloroaromatic compound transport system substrate-binding protein